METSGGDVLARLEVDEPTVEYRVLVDDVRWPTHVALVFSPFDENLSS